MGKPVSAANASWLLLFHQLPPKPAYLRVKIWRKVASIGAIQVKGGIYTLPESRETLEDFQWVLKEITAGGGEGSIVSASFIDGMKDAEVVSLFQSAREADYAELSKQVRAIDPSGTVGQDTLDRLRKRLSDLTKIDFFSSPGRIEVEELLATMESPVPKPSHLVLRNPHSYRGRTWVTRQEVFVDRIASAWLITTMIDSKARFRFMDTSQTLRTGEVGFDYPDAEFTHEGDRCTFETLMTCFTLDAPGLRQVAEVIHDIDCKDGKYRRPEAPGVLAAFTGLSLVEHADADRIVRGGRLLADLQAFFALEGHRRSLRRTAPVSKP